jgi:hypothetical protein
MWALLEAAGVEFIDENGGGATAQSSAAKAAQIGVPSSAVICAST